MATITLEALTKEYDQTRVVDGVSHTIEDGEFFVFVGPSGSGKSTILRLLAGLVQPTQGSIRFDDKDITAREPRERDVAMVFQNYALYPHKTVYENIAFGLRARKIPEDKIDQSVQDASSMLNITDLLDRWPKELSGGERQRVAMGRALVRRPVVFLLDEPLSNLDARLRIEMRHELANIHEKLETTFVYVTHDQVEAMTLGDRIAVINEGRIEQVDTPSQLYHYPANQFVAQFIGSPPMNLISGHLVYRRNNERLGIRLDQGTLNLDGTLREELSFKDGDPVRLGVRSEAITLKKESEASIEGRIIRLEPVGHEGFLYLDLLGHRVVARVTDWQSFQDRSTIDVTIHLNDIYLFSPENGMCIMSNGSFHD